MASKVSLLIDKNWVLIVADDSVAYQKNRSEFQNTTGVDVGYDTVEYNKALGMCIIDGKHSTFPNTWCEEVLELLNIHGSTISPYAGEAGDLAADLPETEQRVIKLKSNLANTDYLVIKFVEGELSAKDYIPIRNQRKAWREEINELENGND